MHIALSVPNSEGQTLLVTTKEPSKKLLLPATAQVVDEEQLKLEDNTLWTNQPSDEFLYMVTGQLFEEEQDKQTFMDEDPGPYFSPKDKNILLRQLEEKFIFTIIRVLIFSLTMNRL